MSGHFTVSDSTVGKLVEPDTPNSKKVWVNFLPNIDFGHLLTMVGFAAALAVQWNAFDKRLTIVEEQSKQLITNMMEQRQNTRDTITEVKGDVKEIKAAVGQMQTSMALTAMQLQQTQRNEKR